MGWGETEEPDRTSATFGRTAVLRWGRKDREGEGPAEVIGRMGWSERRGGSPAKEPQIEGGVART